VGTQAVIDQLQVVKKAMMADLLTRGIPGRHKKFKQTEIGEVPEEWDIRPFADICLAIVDGVHKKPDYVREGIPFVTIKNLTAVEEGISFEDLNYISPEDHAQFTKRTRPERGDILLTKDGTLGIPRVVDTDRAFSIFVSVAVMKPIRSLIDSWFMRFALEAPAIAAHFGVVNAGMALKHIHLVDLRATPCPVPPLAEQREISEAIRSVCSRIVAEKEHLAAVSATKSALMSVLLTGEVRVRVDEEEAA
jgi:type I restriction enzyme S subunit